MPHLIFALISWLVLLIAVRKNRIAQLATSGIIGVVLAVIVDSLCISLGLYRYEKMLFTIDGNISFFHYFYIYSTTILYLNWLPHNRKKRILYTVFLSGLFLVVEAIMHQYGAIVYLKWRLIYSYPLIISGLSVVSALTNKLKLYRLS